MSVKEAHGTRNANRHDVCNEILKGVNNEHQTNAIVSFAIALLPFLNPDKALFNFQLSATKIKEYLRTIRNNTCFHAMAWYLGAINFQFKAGFADELKAMAVDFDYSVDPFELNKEAGLEAIGSATRSFKPSVGAKKVQSNEIASTIENVATILFARRLSTRFDVCLSIFN